MERIEVNIIPLLNYTLINNGLNLYSVEYTNIYDRSESSEFLEEKVKPFDWTFTTNYTGTISGFHLEETKERIDLEKLRRKEKIRFYHDLTLFEDELHDNGIAVCSVKIVSYKI